jgi:hypothetical protein
LSLQMLLGHLANIHLTHREDMKQFGSNK